jgi:hypothetical protein
VYAFKVSFYILVYLTHHETKFGTFRFFWVLYCTYYDNLIMLLI